MAVYLGAVNKKISKGYYRYDTKKFVGFIDQFRHIDGGKYWQYSLMRKSDNFTFEPRDYFKTKKLCLAAMYEQIKELEQYNV